MDNDEKPNDPVDPFEITIRAAHALMRRRRGEEACQLLEDAVQKAVSSKELDHAALFSSIRGSYLFALEKNKDALHAYQNAERYSGGELRHKLRTARHLVDGLKQPEMAIKKLNKILDEANLHQGHIRDALAVRGAALLELGKTEEALRDLDSIAASLMQISDTSDTPQGIGLTLVERFIDRGVAPDECLKFLTIAESKAMRPEEERTLLRIRKLKLRLQ